MRKSDREIIDFNEKIELLERCTTIRLGINGDKFPYVVPLSFGYEAADGKVIIYFHCAKEGEKIRLLKKNQNVCVEADILHGYIDTGKSVTADYESLMGFGRCEEVSGEEAVHGLQLLLNHCATGNYSAAECAAVGSAAVYKVTLSELYGKRRFKRPPILYL